MKIIKCISKNLKVLIRSRVASFVIILAPLLIFLLLEMAFNVPEQYTLHISVFSTDYSNLSNSVVNELNQGYFTVVQANSKEECIENVKGGISNTCLVFPPNMSVGKREDFIEIYLDSSKNNLVWAIKDIIKNKVEKLSLELSKNLTTGIINTIDFVEEVSNTSQSSSLSALEQLQRGINSTTSAISNLNTMSFGFDEDSLDVEAIKKDVKHATTTTENVIVKVRSLLNSLEDKFDAIKDDILAQGLNSSDEDELLALINSTKSSISELSFAIKDNANSSNMSLAQVSEGLQVITQGIADIKTMLAEDSNLKGDAVANLEATSQAISTSKDELSGIKDNLEDILSRLAQITVREPSEIVKPFDVKMVSITPVKTQMSLVFPQFLGILILFISLVIPCVMSVNERRSSAGVRQLLTPVLRVVYVMGMYLTNLLLVLAQVIAVALITQFILKIDILYKLPTLLIGVLASSSAFIMIGIFLGHLFNEEHNATISAVSLASLLLFLSGAILPLEAMPPSFYYINQYNPFVITISVLRRSIFFNTPISAQAREFIILVLYSVVFYLLTFIYIEIMKKRHIFSSIKRLLAR
ncbi:hypothetical protein DRJ48_03115 [Candidatus Woesearchaeota archaeon]|nr:ABC transporter permease [Candidatus Woesearchaeota archaeon]RLE42645.1 MAG: hypothetical protein DRJ48_03115 [Candidatus Woesearchaeota archaeon]